jgi:phenylalanyl-tRNA synthetase beta chain
MRPISAAVDATNYAMLEIGQPLHPFDLTLLKGPGIVVRRAADGERMVTLDDVERTLTDDDLLICDVERAVGIAGVMGGSVAEISDATDRSCSRPRPSNAAGSRGRDGGSSSPPRPRSGSSAGWIPRPRRSARLGPAD